MWYKQFQDGTWSRGNKVIIPAAPQGNIILELNHNAKVDGWEWHDDPPQGYLDWLQSLEVNN